MDKIITANINSLNYYKPLELNNIEVPDDLSDNITALIEKAFTSSLKPYEQMFNQTLKEAIEDFISDYPSLHLSGSGKLKILFDTNGNQLEIDFDAAVEYNLDIMEYDEEIQEWANRFRSAADKLDALLKS